MIKNILVFGSILFFPLISSGQYSTISFSAGRSYYKGDISTNRKEFIYKRALAVELKRQHLFFNYGISYTFMKIAGADNISTSPARKARNLHFISNVHEFKLNSNIHLPYEFIENKIANENRFRVTPFGGIGIGVFAHNPKGDAGGAWIPLRYLMTENVKYSLFSFCATLKTGIKGYVTKRTEIELFTSISATTTDYLDDVSTTYPARDSFDDPASINMSNRSLGAYKEGDYRGDPTNRDSYFFSGLSVCIKIGKK